LNLNGPAASSFAEIEVLNGTLNVAATGIVNDVASTTVAAGATLHVDGAYAGTAGDDVFTVAGTVSGAGSVDLGDGDDVLTVVDTASWGPTTTLEGGGGAGDRVVLDASGTLSFDGAVVAGFEQLEKVGSGTAVLTGVHSYQGTTIDAGALEVGGTLDTATLALADGTTLRVTGTLQGAGGAEAAVAGSAGAETVSVADGATLRATGSLGDGDDILDLAGTLDTGGGTFSLGSGNDTFVVHNTTEVIGTLDAGDGDDILSVNVDDGFVVPLDSTTGFESLGKSGLGTLELNGASSFAEVRIQQGMLDVTSSGSVVAQQASIARDATLTVDGDFLFTAGADRLTVAGTVAGGGTIDMLDGDDLLVLRDGAALLNAVNGGGVGTDAVVLDSDAAYTFDLTNALGFERLVKESSGTATTAGLQTFTGGASVNAGVLEVTGTLETPAVTVADGATLRVAGTVGAAGGALADIVGDGGVNTITVSAGGTLRATGNLGDGADVLDVAGTLDASGGNFDLGAGDDSFVIHDGTTVNGTVVGGDGFDTRVYDLTGNATVGALQQFEGLTKRNTGALTLTGPDDTTDLEAIAVEGGTLNIANDATVIGATTTTVDAGATLRVDGSLLFTAGADTFTVAGAVAGGGTIDLLDGDDHLTLLDGADLSGFPAFLNGGAGNDTLTVNIDTTAALGGAVGFETLVKQGSGRLSVDAPATPAFEAAHIEGGVLEVASGAALTTQTAAVETGAALEVAGDFLFTSGADLFTIRGTVSGAGSIDLLDGDDHVVIGEGADLSGLLSSLEGGAGNDTLTTDIATAATLGGATGFEALVKDGAGILTVTGPAPSAFDTVLVRQGSLDVGAGAAVATQSATVQIGATLDVDGTFGFTAGGDTFTVAGTVEGAGVIDMLDGDDQLVILDFADLSGLGTA